MGAQDHVFLKAAQRFAKKQKETKLVIFEKCGHICNIEKWKDFNRVAVQFLQEATTNDLESQPLEMGMS